MIPCGLSRVCPGGPPMSSNRLPCACGPVRRRAIAPCSTCTRRLGASVSLMIPERPLHVPQRPQWRARFRFISVTCVTVSVSSCVPAPPVSSPGVPQRAGVFHVFQPPGVPRTVLLIGGESEHIPNERDWGGGAWSSVRRSNNGLIIHVLSALRERGFPNRVTKP